jgi:NADPH:quinone reductase-like Zn-dependent oxidoreductase
MTTQTIEREEKVALSRNTMTAVLVPHGAGIESIEFASRPIPQPGEQEVLIRVHAASLNYRDLLFVRGQ